MKEYKNCDCGLVIPTDQKYCSTCTIAHKIQDKNLCDLIRALEHLSRLRAILHIPSAQSAIKRAVQLVIKEYDNLQ